MKILPIQNNFGVNKVKKIDAKQTNNDRADLQRVSYPANYYITSFKGINLSKMYEEYNWYINHDHIPAIKSFLKINAPKEEMDEFLSHILSTSDRSYELIDSIASMPRETTKIVEALKQKVGEESKILGTYLYNSPYYQAYEKYIQAKYENAHNLTELLKIRPDWSGEALIKKYISKTGNDELKIGNLPKQVPKEHWEKIIPYLREKMEIGLKQDKKIDNFVVDGRTYEFKYFTEGKSSKNVFGFFVPIMMKKYVVKMDSPVNRSLDEPFALGTLAKIDAYLTSNASRNSAPLCYYDHKNNFSIYKYIEHTPIGEHTTDINTIQKHLADFRDLGLSYNDTVGYKNYFLLNEKSLDTHYKMLGFQDALNKQEWISVDNDHVTYSNNLHPNIRGYHKYLPNGMGMFF